jgi:transcriptional regulator with XRE-family HTH domain
MSEIGKRIRKIRNLEGETQVNFGRRLQVDRGHISNVETGKAKPSAALIKLICMEYGINELWLLNGEGDMKKSEEAEKPPYEKIIDMPLLRDVIEAVEAGLNKAALFLEPDRKADFICLIYENYLSLNDSMHGDKTDKINNVLKYLKIMFGDVKPVEKQAEKSVSEVYNTSGKGNISGKNVNISNTNQKGGYFQAGGNATITVKTKTGKIHVLPPINSIGADPLLKQNIQTLFNKIGEAREKRFGKSAYPAMYNTFKRDFGIKNNPWTIIWTWPRECAYEIIAYLQFKYDNTIQGRMEKAANREDYIHSRPQLYRLEMEYLSHFELEMDSPEVKELLYNYFGVTSHKRLTHIQHWQLVKYLEAQVEKIEKN